MKKNNGSSSETEDNRKALLEMLNSNSYYKFLQFLREQGQKEILLFWCEVEDFKSIPSSQQAFIQGRQQKVIKLLSLFRLMMS